MANDPNRDLLPVKEESSYREINERVDHKILVKLSRSELEDRFLRLLDDQTQLKKLINSQEEKIKRLGTKLLRIINEKKVGKKSQDQSKESEDLHLKIVELQHENYALKDRNIVLKQQLVNHSRHMTVHRSPVRSDHTSPLMSIRQSAPPLHSEHAYDAMSKNVSIETQLHESEAHIRELNEEIKSLHDKIDYLQQNLERNTLDNRKMKVSENIELIRLQRSLKQQAIQIASLQAQVKHSENNQRILKEELIKAHKENDEALNALSVKQKEILDLCSKLEQNNVNRLEENELRERINDLMLERNKLKESSDFLMKSIGAKEKENKQVDELKQLLAEEKVKKEKLESALEAAQKLIIEIQNSKTDFNRPSTDCSTQVMLPPLSLHHELPSEIHKKESFSTEHKPCSVILLQDASSGSIILHKNKYDKVSHLNPDFENATELSDIIEERSEASEHNMKYLEEKYYADKVKTEREIQFLRDMLRSQTSRCEAQQTEISRLMYELRLNEDKCNETLRRLDSHLKAFQTLEMSSLQNKPSPETKILEEEKAIYAKADVDLENQFKDNLSNDTLKDMVSQRKTSKPESETKEQRTSFATTISELESQTKDGVSIDTVKDMVSQRKTSKPGSETKEQRTSFATTISELESQTKDGVSIDTVKDVVSQRKTSKLEAETGKDQRKSFAKRISELEDQSNDGVSMETVKDVVSQRKTSKLEAETGKDQRKSFAKTISELEDESKDSLSIESLKDVIDQRRTSKQKAEATRAQRSSYGKTDSDVVNHSDDSISIDTSNEVINKSKIVKRKVEPVREKRTSYDKANSSLVYQSDDSSSVETLKNFINQSHTVKRKIDPKKERRTSYLKSDSDMDNRSKESSSSGRLDDDNISESKQLFSVEEISLKAEPTKKNTSVDDPDILKNESKPKERFVDQVFLESSDEDNENETNFERQSLIKKLEKLEHEKQASESKKMKSEEEGRAQGSNLSDSPGGQVLSQKRRYSSGSFSSKFPSDSSLQFQNKTLSTEKRKDLQYLKGKQKQSENLENSKEIEISIHWLQLEKSGSLWKNDEIKLLFVDFSFLDVKGEETETPKSLPKPKNPEDKCHFDFSKKIDMNESKMDIFHSLLNKPDLDLIVFKVVSEPEEIDNESACQDVGVAVVTVKMFLEKSGTGPFPIRVNNMNYIKEVVGTLCVSVSATAKVFKYKN